VTIVNKGKQDVSPGWESSSRGERAWKETVEDLASRNAQARKAGRVEREAYEHERADAPHAAAAERHKRLLARRTP
jgi:hypothetical protein